MDKVLLQYLYHKIIPEYRFFDAAHQMDHVESVITDSLAIAKDYDVNYDMVYVIACYHDIGMKFGRQDHHLTGGLFLYEDVVLQTYFTQEQRQLMREAIEDHRASRQDPPRSIYGKIIAEADRDIDPQTIILRTVLFGIKHFPNLDETSFIERALTHIEEKYGPNGYLKLWLKTDKNTQGLKEIAKRLHQKEALVETIRHYYIKNKK